MAQKLSVEVSISIDLASNIHPVDIISYTGAQTDKTDLFSLILRYQIVCIDQNWKLGMLQQIFKLKASRYRIIN